MRRSARPSSHDHTVGSARRPHCRLPRPCPFAGFARITQQQPATRQPHTSGDMTWNRLLPPPIVPTPSTGAALTAQRAHRSTTPVMRIGDVACCADHAATSPPALPETPSCWPRRPMTPPEWFPLPAVRAPAPHRGESPSSMILRARAQHQPFHTRGLRNQRDSVPGTQISR
jgi:hypothetical protein